MIRFGHAERFAKAAPYVYEGGVVPATQFGAWCFQASSPMLPDPANPYSEDCLFLNVWRPSAERAGRPVLFAATQQPLARECCKFDTLIKAEWWRLHTLNHTVNRSSSSGERTYARSIYGVRAGLENMKSEIVMTGGFISRRPSSKARRAHTRAARASHRLIPSGSLCARIVDAAGGLPHRCGIMGCSSAASLPRMETTPRRKYKHRSTPRPLWKRRHSKTAL